MHELPVVQKILNIVLNYAEANKAEQVTQVFLEIGKLHDLIPEWVEKYFRFASRGTIAERTRLWISQPPVFGRCEDCGKEYEIDIYAKKAPVCPACGSGSKRCISGDQFRICSIEVKVSNEKTSVRETSGTL